MKRRNFFALLFAPLLARFAPKPKFKRMPNGSEFKFILDEWVQIIEVWPKPPAQAEVFFLFPEGIKSSKYGIISRPVPPYWHGQPPFVELKLDNFPWTPTKS